MAWEKFEHGEKQTSITPTGRIPRKVLKIQGYTPWKSGVELKANSNFIAVDVHKHTKSGYFVQASERGTQLRDAQHVEFRIPNRAKLLAFFRTNGVKLVEKRR